MIERCLSIRRGSKRLPFLVCNSFFLFESCGGTMLGETPLHLAAIGGSKDCCKIALSYQVLNDDGSMIGRILRWRWRR